MPSLANKKVFVTHSFYDQVKNENDAEFTANSHQVFIAIEPAIAMVASTEMLQFYLTKSLHGTI